MSKYLQDLISGPLNRYRTKTSFNWKKLKVFLETEEIVQYQNKLYKIVENHPLFTTHKLSTKSVDEQRQITFQSACQLLQIEEISWPYMLLELRRPAAMTRVLVSTTMDSFLKQLLSNSMFLSAIRGMGTARHQQFIDDADNQKILGCYCLTEIGHGSNTKGMRTTATYDKRKKVFILNSPNFEDAKCWAGGLGQAAMYGIVYAQLVIEDTYYGLHAFVVPFRDPQTLLPYPGLEIGDMGLKIGLNGLDNGFVRFMNYEIPRVNLLNKLADVTEDGRYVTPIKDPSKRHGAGLGILSGGRVNIGCIIDALGANALTIAIRYAAVRKQFGPENQAEVPILEYQSHQLRLLPYLAATYVFRIFNDFMSEHFYKFSLNTMSGNPGSDAAALGMEIHGISSASKPVIGWIVKEAIQKCREACGGHGYLHAARLGDIRNEADPALTYEGENHVLIQQTINWLLKLAPQVLEGKYVFSPLGSTNFLTNGLSILKNSRFTARSVDELRCPQSILKIFQWIVTFLLKTTYEKLEEELKSGKSLFIARNNTQVYYGKSLAMAFIQHFSLQKMLEKISESKDPAIKAVLTRLFSLFGLWAIDKWHMATLYKGEFATGPIPATLIQEAILKLCEDLKDDAVALVDVIAVPDFILRSVLGASDGNVYQHLQDSMVKDEYNMNRPTWWKDIVAFTQKNAAVSKL